jgi:hypothetical protein
MQKPTMANSMMLFKRMFETVLYFFNVSNQRKNRGLAVERTWLLKCLQQRPYHIALSLHRKKMKDKKFVL